MSYDEHLISMAGGDVEPDLDAIQARADKATEGPWFREYSDVVTAHPDPRDVEEGYEDARNSRVVRGAPHLPKKDRQGIADADFIAHARTDVPALLARVRSQQAKIERVRELHVQKFYDKWGRTSETPTEYGGWCNVCSRFDGHACHTITALTATEGAA